MSELADRMAAGVARVRGPHGNAAAARRRLRAIGVAYLEFARDEPGLFATAFALPQPHAYGAADHGAGLGPSPLGQLRAVLDELLDAGVLSRPRRDGLEYPIWSAVHGLAVLTGRGRCVMSLARPAVAWTRSPWPSSTRAWPDLWPSGPVVKEVP